MSSCFMKSQDSDEEVDLEALRLAALKSRKPKCPRVNHNNLIPIVPVPVQTTDVVNTKIKVEKPSPPPEGKVKDETKEEKNKENEDERASNYSESTIDNDQDFINMEDKEEEDSLERLMDQLEAEISGKAPIPTNHSAASKNSSGSKKEKRKKSKKSFKETGGDDEIELVQIKTGREPGAIIEIRESASPELNQKGNGSKKSYSPTHANSPRRSKSRVRSRTRSPYFRARSYRRSRSPYWSKSPRRSRSPFRRSRSPFWMSRRSRSTSRRSRSPFRRYRSPGRKRSPFMRFSRSRSRSFDRRRSPWSLSPRGRSRSPFYRDGLPPLRRRNYNSPPGRSRRSFTPREGSKSPRRRSRSPRRFPRSPPFRRSRSPFRRSRSPFRARSSIRRSHSPYIRRSKSPFTKLNSPLSNRSPLGRRYSKSPTRRSLPKLSDRPSSKARSKSPGKRNAPGTDRSPGHVPGKEKRSLSISASPTPRRNRSPLRVLEKNKLETKDKTDSYRDRNRSDNRHRSLSRENRTRDRRGYRQNYHRRFSPSRNKRNSDKTARSKSPKPEETAPKDEEAVKKDVKEKESSPVSAEPLDPILEARKKKFENLSEIDPSVDKKISLKSIKESSENVEDDEDALTINVEGNLWDESEESEDDFESRFKSSEARKNRIVVANRNVLSFRNLREGDGANKKINLNKPLTEDSRRDKFGRTDRQDRWQGRRNDRASRNDRRKKYPDGNRRSDENESGKNRSKSSDKINSQNSNIKRSDRKPIIWSDKSDKKSEVSSKDNEVSTTQSEVKESRSRNSDKTLIDIRDKTIKSNEVQETDDFDKLISDFEKELEGDLCGSTKETSSTSSANQAECKKPKISVKKDLFDSNANPESPIKRSAHRTIRLNDISLNKPEKSNESTNVLLEKKESDKVLDGPEDYVEDDDFELEPSAGSKLKSKEDEDSQSDLRAVLSRRRNQRLTKVVSLKDNVPKRLVQSAFQGLGNKKSKRQIREILEESDLPIIDRNVKTSGLEGRRVLLLQRDKNTSVPSVKCAVTEAIKPDTTIYQRFPRANERRKRKFQRVMDPVEDLDQEEEETFEMEEEKQSRRIRLKRNVTISSQMKQIEAQLFFGGRYYKTREEKVVTPPVD